MPAIECTKDITVNLTRERDRLVPSRAGSLRHMICSIVSDGDFRSCALTDDTVVEITTARNRGGALCTRTRHIPITRFTSVADCITEA